MTVTPHRPPHRQRPGTWPVTLNCKECSITRRACWPPRSPTGAGRSVRCGIWLRVFLADEVLLHARAEERMLFRYGTDASPAHDGTDHLDRV